MKKHRASYILCETLNFASGFLTYTDGIWDGAEENVLTWERWNDYSLKKIT
jgi:hypothetical protein